MTATELDRVAAPDATAPPQFALEVVRRWPALRAGAVAASAAIVAGGLVAALTRPLEIEVGPWVAAFLVLVGGVAQLVVTTAAIVLPNRAPSRAARHALVGAWNGAVVATIAGTVAELPLLTTASTAVLAFALAGVWRSLRDAPYRWRTVTWSVRAVLGVVLLSLPVGLVLAWLRHG